MKPGIIRQLDIMHEISMSCLRWYPRDGSIIACERPAAVHLDERERLHNDLGPVIEFRYGRRIYRIHDVDERERLHNDLGNYNPKP